MLMPKPSQIGKTDSTSEATGAMKLAVRSTDTHPEEIVKLGIDRLSPNPYQPRVEFDPDSIKELAASIKEHGQIQPITVCERSDGKDGYWIVAGERRLRACKHLGLHFVKCVIKPAMDEKQLQIVALQENIQRENLHPVEVAIAMQRMVDTKVVVDLAELGQVNGFGHKTTYRYMAIAKLSSPTMELAVKKDYRNVHVLEAIGRLIAPTGQKNILKKIIDDGLDQTTAVDYIKSVAKPETVKTAQPISVKINGNGKAKIVLMPALNFKKISSDAVKELETELQSVIEKIATKYKIRGA